VAWLRARHCWWREFEGEDTREAEDSGPDFIEAFENALVDIEEAVLWLADDTTERLHACWLAANFRLKPEATHLVRADIVNIGRPMSDKDEESKDTTELKPPPRSVPWAMLLRRVFVIDVLKCGTCGGTMKVLAIVPASDAEEALEHEPRAPLLFDSLKYR